jgi:MFS transporter, DHA2 family, multidrug resistance protein
MITRKTGLSGGRGVGLAGGREGNGSGTLAGNRRWWALGAITLSVLAVGIDQTVLSLALPTLAKNLHATSTELQWFVAAFSIAMVAFLLPAGLLGDRFGRRKMLLLSLSLFGLGSLACAYSPSPAALIAARTVLGLGAAFLVPLSMSVVTVLFTDEERPRAFGIWAAANFLAFPLGPILGGLFLEHFWWGSVFLINVPVVALALVAAAFLLPESRSERKPKVDVAGILLSSVGLTGVIYAVIESGNAGWASPLTIVPLTLGAVLLVLFGLQERRLDRSPGGQPLVDVSLFREASFTWGTILAAVSIFGMSGMLFTLPQHFIAIMHDDSLTAGLQLLPLIGGLLIGLVLASRLGARLGTRVLAAAGFAFTAVTGAIAASSLRVETTYGTMAIWLVILGAGLGLSLISAATGALAKIPRDQSGVGSAVMQALQKVGVPLGTAVLGTLFSSVYVSHLALAGMPEQVASGVRKSVFAGMAAAAQLKSPDLLASVQQAFVKGMDTMMWASAGIAVVGMMLSLLFLPGKQAGAAETKGRGRTRMPAPAQGAP